MFTEKDRQMFDKTFDKFTHIGEKIGDFIHVNARGIIRILIIVVTVILMGSFYLLITLLRRSFGKKN